jgi:enamidase
MTVTIHTGGPSIAGSSPIDAETVIEADPHVVGHVNGGTTSMSPREIERLVGQTGMALEIVHCGNPRTALHTLRIAREAGAADRVILGNDAPSGTGVVPLGILRTLALLAALGDCPPEVAVAMATGNTARVYGLPVGLLAPGREADLTIADAPVGSVARTALDALRAGDLPGVSMVVIDGVPRLGRSRNTAPAAEVTRGHAPGGGH